jgi:ParB family chromosome partitioning protein
MSKQIEYIFTTQIKPHPDNPRKDLGDLTELADSIKANGILQNLTVVPNPIPNTTPQQYTYTVIIGHRRLAAAKLAGLDKVPCVVTEMTPQEQLRTMLMENMQRSDLTTYEQAQGFQLMLDMGETMENLAKDSGFSVSTIRRRVKLLELDQDKFRKAEARGATLMDYLELDKIEDPARKNAVLDTIGTPNFRNRLQSAIDEEKCLKRLDEWEAEIAKFATRIEERGTVDGEKVPMDYERNYNRWNMNTQVERPSDVNSVKYYYVRSGMEITLYRTPREKVKTEEDIAREERQAAFERTRAELREITERHFNLRNEFISNLSQSAVKKHFADVAVFAMYQIIGDGGYRRDDPEPEVLELCFDLDLDEDVDYDELRKMLTPKAKESPEKSILSSVYAMVDDAGMGYWESNWVYEKRRYECNYKPNDELDRLYVLLGQLGYEVSDEEAEMMNGTHALLQPSEDE